MPQADPDLTGAGKYAGGYAARAWVVSRGVRSGPGPAGGFIYDHCSPFYPMAVSSRAIQRLELEPYGLRWTSAPGARALK